MPSCARISLLPPSAELGFYELKCWKDPFLYVPLSVWDSPSQSVLCCNCPQGGQPQKCFCPVSGEAEDNSSGILGRGGAKVCNKTSGMLLHQPPNISVQDLLRDWVLFVFQGCCVPGSSTLVVWGSSVTILPTLNFNQNKMVCFTVPQQYLVSSHRCRSWSTWGWPPGNLSKNKFSFCNTYLFISHVKWRALVYFSLLCVQISWPTTPQTFWTPVAPTYCNAKQW